MKFMFRLALAFIVTLFHTITLAQTYTGPIAKPTTGYGADGSATITSTQISNPVYTEDITVFYPSGTASPVPTIFFAHGFALTSVTAYQGFIHFLVSKGYAVVHVPYPVADVGTTRYQILEQGFVAAATSLPSIIDINNVGFIGHSFGGGAIFAIANNLYNANNWGTSSMFLVPIAQWYSLNISQTQLENFNPNAKLLAIINEDDTVTDHRMAIDIFRNINIPNAEKDIALLKTDVVSGYTYTSDHLMVTTSSVLNDFDALDYYGLYRLVDALSDYTFNNNSAAKTIALGNGSAAQVQMPSGMSNLVVDDTMGPTLPESNYASPCSSSDNPRSSVCSTLSVNAFNEQSITFYPNPADDVVTITNHQNISSLNVFDVNAKSVLQLSDITSPTFDVSTLKPGLYFIKLETTSKDIIYKKLIKQ